MDENVRLLRHLMIVVKHLVFKRLVLSVSSVKVAARLNVELFVRSRLFNLMIDEQLVVVQVIRSKRLQSYVHIAVWKVAHTHTSRPTVNLLWPSMRTSRIV